MANYYNSLSNVKLDDEISKKTGSYNQNLCKNKHISKKGVNNELVKNNKKSKKPQQKTIKHITQYAGKSKSKKPGKSKSKKPGKSKSKKPGKLKSYQDKKFKLHQSEKSYYTSSNDKDTFPTNIETNQWNENSKRVFPETCPVSKKPDVPDCNRMPEHCYDITENYELGLIKWLTDKKKNLNDKHFETNNEIYFISPYANFIYKMLNKNVLENKDLDEYKIIDLSKKENIYKRLEAYVDQFTKIIAESPF